ncbi:unnamed protein product [Rotaria magnacalcarata]|uniref:Uncharacterized protein n=1 Tax=Rotaria magnacalcarata TaxID=392030 RepID=A0A8S2RJD1_9BILA|nr:unnamed protein product [Rotaria magnacalcarata]CAF4232689.1 unnamed protein product [Rotaria magnacalcarata]
MTFKGMLKILINDYRKQHDAKMFSLVQELIKTQRELRDVKEQLQALQTDDAGTSFSKRRVPVQTVCLFVQYNGFFNQQCELRHTMTIGELLVRATTVVIFFSS